MFYDGILFLLNILGAGLTAFVAMLATEPKKQRIAEYNQFLKEFKSHLDKTHNYAIQYWSRDGQIDELEAFLMAAKTESSSSLLAINRKQCDLLNYPLASKKMYSYFKLITGDTFRQVSREADSARLDAAVLILCELKDYISSAHISCTTKNILFLRI